MAMPRRKLTRILANFSLPHKTAARLYTTQNSNDLIAIRQLMPHIYADAPVRLEAAGHDNCYFLVFGLAALVKMLLFFYDGIKLILIVINMPPTHFSLISICRTH
jgi:hypothetical protein